MSKAFIGASGWTYDGWRGRFYLETLRKSDGLAWYASQFRTTEINGSNTSTEAAPTTAAMPRRWDLSQGRTDTALLCVIRPSCRRGWPSVNLMWVATRSAASALDFAPTTPGGVAVSTGRRAAIHPRRWDAGIRGGCNERERVRWQAMEING